MNAQALLAYLNNSNQPPSEPLILAIEITQELITNSTAGDIDHCALAAALRPHLPACFNCFVGPTETSIYDKRFRLPQLDLVHESIIECWQYVHNTQGRAKPITVQYNFGAKTVSLVTPDQAN